MKPVQFLIITGAAIALLANAAVVGENGGNTLLDHDVRRLNAEETVNLQATYGGNVALIVNTASRCAFTDQYAGLEALYARYRDRGFVVLGFPSNDFGNQEPGSEAAIQDFCRLTYSVRFPMFAKTSVKKGAADPLFAGLAESAGRYPSWNFHKYLVDREGRLVADFRSRTSPQDSALLDAIEKAL
jgi:glutathione peroxidase